MKQIKKLSLLSLALVAAFVAVTLSGCGRKNATPLLDGQILSAVDNSLGEGVKNNLRTTPSWQNHTTADTDRGFIWTIAATDTETAKWFATIKVGGRTMFVDVTNLQNGTTINAADTLAGAPAGATIAPNSTAHNEVNTARADYTTSVTTTKYFYDWNARTKWLNVYTDLYTTVTVISPYAATFGASITGLTFTIYSPTTSTHPVCLSQNGDSWEIQG